LFEFVNVLNKSKVLENLNFLNSFEDLGSKIELVQEIDKKFDRKISSLEIILKEKFMIFNKYD